MEDEKIVAWFLDSGDQAAFSELVERYQARVFRLVCSVLGPFLAEEAEDVTQEIFLKVFLKARLFKEKSSFRPWLYRLAYNTALDWRRRQASRGYFSIVKEDEEKVAAEEKANDPLDDFLTRENKEMVARAVEKLPELYRTLIYMFYWLDVPLEEIGEELSLPVGTVKSYLFRARDRLKILLMTNSAGRESEQSQNSQPLGIFQPRREK
jgi:RNA polymerase sigma-70 factor (ECF subfamily)